MFSGVQVIPRLRHDYLPASFFFLLKLDVLETDWRGAPKASDEEDKFRETQYSKEVNIPSLW